MRERAPTTPTYLKDVDPFADVREAEYCRIAPGTTSSTYARGDIVYDPAHPPTGIYVVKRGEVVLSHVGKDRSTLIDTIGPGGVFGDFSLTGRAPSHTAAATRTTTVCVTPVEEFLRVVALHPELTLHVMRRLADRLHDAESRLRASMSSAEERILAELRLMRDQQIAAGNDPTVRLMHVALAARTGLNRVTVTRALGVLREAKRLRVLPEGGFEL